jgi:hypothetical protein
MRDTTALFSSFLVPSKSVRSRSRSAVRETGEGEREGGREGGRGGGEVGTSGKDKR